MTKIDLKHYYSFVSLWHSFHTSKIDYKLSLHFFYFHFVLFVVSFLHFFKIRVYQKMFKIICVVGIMLIGAHKAEGQNFKALAYEEEGPCILEAYNRDLGPHVAASFAKLVGRSGSVSLKLKSNK